MFCPESDRVIFAPSLPDPSETPNVIYTRRKFRLAHQFSSNFPGKEYDALRSTHHLQSARSQEDQHGNSKTPSGS